jgi:hypothetical protein
MWVVGLLHCAGGLHQSAKAFPAYSEETIQSIELNGLV